MYTTARGEWTSVTLTDSSSVVLAPETKLQYTIDSRGARRVDLVGEAFFTVAPNTRSPFVVHTGAVTTSVMGTSFDIRHYPDDRSTQVVVTTGRVATGGRFTPVVLAAGSIGHLTDSSVVISPDGNVDGLTSWTQGHLVFHDTQVSAMLSTLGRWSGYEFRLTDRVLAESHVSIGFNANQPEAALQTLKAVLGVTMTFDGNVITLRPEPDGGNAPKGAPIRDVKQHPEPEVGK
jgi:ferric-dicitrate binding protein FerR (iron transport regulator)